MENDWDKPEVEEVEVAEDGTSSNCQGKRIGCYAGSSCAQVKKDEEGDEGKEE